MQIVRNIKEIRIDWLKVAEACSAASPWGPMIAPDGTIYSPDGRVLATASAAAAASTPAAAAGPANSQTGSLDSSPQHELRAAQLIAPARGTVLPGETAMLALAE